MRKLNCFAILAALSKKIQALFLDEIKVSDWEQKILVSRLIVSKF